MKSFLLNKNNKPVIRWGSIPDGLFYEGKIPKGYSLAICPGKYIIIDVDVKNDKNGFNYIPKNIYLELGNTFYYNTRSGGRHYWLLYTGNEILINKSTEFGIDLRIGEKKNNSGGYVKYNYHVDIRKCEHLIEPTSKRLNKWLEKLFT